MLGLVGLLLNVVALVVFIIVLIKQFQIGGAVHGIIGIITCGLWTFIWGWINVKRANIMPLMLIWTAIIICCIVMTVFLGGASFNYSYSTGG